MRIIVSKKIYLIGLVLLCALSPVIANDNGIVLFSDDITGNIENVDNGVVDDTEEIANDNELSDNESSNVEIANDSVNIIDSNDDNNVTHEIANDSSNDSVEIANDSSNDSVEIANENNLSNNETSEIANENDLSNNDSSNDSEDIANESTTNESDNYKQFKNHWYDFMRGTEYELYNNSKKTISQIENEKRFNCYDGAYYTIYLAKHYGLEAEIVHTHWDGIGHGATRVYLPDGSTEIFDTTQYQWGYGKDGANLKWNKVDHYSTNLAREQADKELESNPIKKVFNEVKIVLFGNKEKENDFSVDLSVDLSTELSL